MKFSKSELDIIYQYAAPTKAETLAGMKEIVPVIKDILTKAIVENAIRKLEKIPEPECSQFVAATKARFLAERDNSVRQRLAAAKLQEPIMQGHDLSGKERFRPETRHMITLEVQKDCFIGFKGERFRFYLSDEGYHNAKHSEQEGEIKIKSHAAVVAGKLYPNKKPRQQMISVDFQSAPNITGEATLPLRWLRQLLLCGLAARKSFRKRIPFSKSRLYNRASDKS